MSALTEPTFSAEEYAERLRRVRERMAAQDLGCVVSTDPANMHYLTGYDGWSFYTPQCVVVPLEGEVSLFTRQMDANGARLTTALPDERIFGFPDDYVQQPDRHPMDWIAGVLREQGEIEGTVGLELDSYYFTARAYESLKAGLPGSSFADSKELVNWVRAIKSKRELELMRAAARIAERVMATAMEVVEPGVRQCDAVAEIYRTAMRGTEEAGGEYTGLVPMLPSGPGTATPHLTWSDDPFNHGEATILELAGCHRRYHCPIARTVFLGDPPAKLADTAKVTVEGLAAALDAVRPGVTCEEVEATWRRHIAAHGLEKSSRIGYSVGAAYPPDWGEHTMSLRPGDTTVLQPNMTFHMIVGMWMDDWGFEASETFLVTESNAECLASFPRELAVKP
jgi:ectoine hydrolase